VPDPPRIAELRAEAHHARERLDLYRARIYGPRATRPERLQELQRISERAQERLDAALRDGPQNTTGPGE
jgi:hypothetical protein